jgi:hypothetical protein
LDQAVPITSLTKDPLDPSLVSLIEFVEKKKEKVFLVFGGFSDQVLSFCGN